ncbi:hypothetical protein QC762_700105 [Podospora pseudocomata]|uniref:Uncharacterized protein n=1 Tax=Podospora pseudocomata TaxID=2093779 RepID=A0ABR0G5Q6_9PEZI|nr:hypothetical protein QC762_700105 [Podospora pseudocomata]
MTDYSSEDLSPSPMPTTPALTYTMAAPSQTSVLDISGRWRFNRKLSDNMKEAYKMQGTSFWTRKLLSFMTIEQEYIKHPYCLPFSDDVVFSFQQTVRRPWFGGCRFHIPMNDNMYILDNEDRAVVLPAPLGPVRVRCRYDFVNRTPTYTTGEKMTTEKSGAQIGQMAFESGMETDPDVGLPERAVMIEVMESLSQLGKGAGWRSTVEWGFEVIAGEKRLVKWAVTVKGSQVAKVKMVYDYVGESIARSGRGHV